MLFVPLSGEVWLNTINSRFVLAVISCCTVNAADALDRRGLAIAGLFPIDAKHRTVAD